MDIGFHKISDYPRGTLRDMLIDANSFELRFERDWLNQWQEFDDFFFDNPKIADNCGFITTVNDKPVGFVSWDPRKRPEFVEIGHNCILTKYKGNGYGAIQMTEAVKRISELCPEKIIVCTNEICVPAQRTYEKAGFKFVCNSVEPYHPEYAGHRIHYEIVFASK